MLCIVLICSLNVVQEDGHEIHGMESRVVEVGWGLQGLGQGL
jgi:hypothetical protein